MIAAVHRQSQRCPSHRIRARTPLVALASLCAVSCQNDLVPQFKPPVVCRTSAPVTESLFLIGDVGAPQLPAASDPDPRALVDPVLRALAADVAEQVEKLGADRVAVVVLGDNVYPSGLPPVGEEGREWGERVLDAQIAAIGEARGLFTLGNHDWDQGKLRGWARARAQADYIASRGPNVSLHPGQTCAGPEELNFGDHLHLVFFDLWAALYQIEHPEGPQQHCSPRAGDGRLRDELDRILGDVGARRTVLVTHPPLLTSGPHGGYFPWREHVFPFRVFDRSLWIPLPILGSIFPLARMLGATDTDQMSGPYRNYVESAKSLFEAGHPTLVAAGHEHSLQVHVDPLGTFHAVSGAGSVSKVDYVREMRSDLMSLAAPGFMRLDAHGDATLRLGVTALDDDFERRLVFSTCIP